MATLTIELLNSLLNTYRTGTQLYIGLLSAASAAESNILTGDSLLTALGADEVTAYAATTRPAVSFAAASGGAMQGTAVTFAITDTISVGGIFICTGATKGGAIGTLLGVSLFSAAKSFSSGDSFTDTPSVALTTA